MARYLITGIGGFIGSWLAKELVARGETVRGFDNLSTGTLANIANIEDCIEFFHADLRNPNALDAACKGVSYIFHEAAIASVQQSIEDPDGTAGVNLGGTLNLIAAAKKHGVKRIVFASSSAVYGDQAQTPITEASATNPLSPYAAQKLRSEQALIALAAETAVETVILRYFNVFGPNQSATSPYSGVIAKFAQGMLSQPDCTCNIYGDGQQSRDFVFIKDVVNANLLAMHAPASEVSGKAFNIGTARATTIRFTFEAIACMTGYTGNPTHLQPRPGEVRRSVASIDAAQQAFGYRPGTSFAAGLNQTVNWYRSQIIKAKGREVASLRKVPGLAAASSEVPSEFCADRHISAHAFASAIQNEELELFYQPILHLAQRRVVGVEALLRWRYGQRLLTPAHFIHLAEEKGLTPTLGAWVLGKACVEAVRFQKEFRADLRLAVNISPTQLEQRDLIRTVDAALQHSGLAPAHLDLEVTERTLVRDCDGTQQNLLHLRRRGIQIAVDDFGTGFSNMNYLHRFPIDCIKIDQSFVQHKGHTRILDGIVAFAKVLGVRTVAEGVETPHQLDHVTLCGCDEAQGYHIGRPVPASQLFQTIQVYEQPLRQITEARDRFHTVSLPLPLADDSSDAPPR